MTVRDWATWLPPALLLLHIPGCFSLSCPDTVTGTVGGSLSVQCWYEEDYRAAKKVWSTYNYNIVETEESEREVRNGRASIRDHRANLTIEVTLDSLTFEDTGTYWCGMERFNVGSTYVTVKVLVFPATTSASSPLNFTGTAGPPMSLPVHTQPRPTAQDSPGPSPQPWCLLGSAQFLIPVLLKLPLLFSALCGILWASRPQRSRGPGSVLQGWDYGHMHFKARMRVLWSISCPPSGFHTGASLIVTKPQTPC
ncbi:CMRF35-like molecule 6 [Nycticebus coucang]|uniref:CMRF35-like molecule 6 n=1 Tax=Nycticebus coucang TaxID=9470 RepID=UPI00234D986B|nr:CMRF35-like molecule 6 [Nycticebus coucang]